jgi:hypothetical protein
MSLPEINAGPAVERQPPPRQFTLLALMRLFVVLGVICTTAVWFDVPSAVGLAAVTLVLYFPPWVALPSARKGRCALVAGAITLVWMVMLTVPFLTVVAIILPTALFLARTAFLCLLFFVALTPLGLSFAQGVGDYCRGQAVLRTEGYPWNLPTLDRETRCYWQSSGCVVQGHEWAIHQPYNHAVRAMTSLFGHMRGVYTGPYPTESEAIAALEGRTLVLWEDLLEGRVVLGRVVIPVDETVRTWLQAGYDEQNRIGVSTEPAAILWKEECVLIQLDDGGRLQDHCVGSPVVGIAVTTKTGEPIMVIHDRTLGD